MTLFRNPQSAIRNLWSGIVAFLLLLAADTASACSVCYGDPESPLTKGALGGVIVLGGVVYSLLLGFVGVGAYWFVRARRAGQLGGTDRSPAASSADR